MCRSYPYCSINPVPVSISARKTKNADHAVRTYSVPVSSLKIFGEGDRFRLVKQVGENLFAKRFYPIFLFIELIFNFHKRVVVFRGTVCEEVRELFDGHLLDLLRTAVFLFAAAACRTLGFLLAFALFTAFGTIRAFFLFLARLLRCLIGTFVGNDDLAVLVRAYAVGRDVFEAVQLAVDDAAFIRVHRFKEDVSLVLDRTCCHTACEGTEGFLALCAVVFDVNHDLDVVAALLLGLNLYSLLLRASSISLVL